MVRKILTTSIGLLALLYSVNTKATNPLPELETYKAEINLLPLDSLSLPEYDDLENTIHDLFTECWDNMRVNPYNLSVDSLLANSDSLYIDFSGFSYPLATHYRVTSNFGPRKYRYHYGIDLKVFIGDTINSVLDGVVRIAKKGTGYGNYVVVRHNNGMESVYGHLNEILVEPNQVVKSGELIGYGGNTGRSTGPHLHFELRYKGVPINPTDIVCFDNLCAKTDTLCLCKTNFAYRTAATALATNIWKVKNGDSLGKIASRTGTSITRLCSLNKLTRKSVLRIGQRIKY